MFKSIFARPKKIEKLYKIVYTTSHGRFADQYVLVVSGEDPVEAIDKFYRKLCNVQVTDIREFTELKFNSEEKEKGAGAIE